MKNDSNFNSTGSGYRDKNKGIILTLIVTLLLVFVIGAIVLTRSHNKSTEEATMLENQKLDLATELNQRDSIINEWVLAFNEIESDIRKITARENMLTMQSMNPEISRDKKQEILNEIKLIKDLIDQNKKKIASLNAQLRKSGVNIAGLQAQIDTLDATITRRDSDIAALRMELVDRDFEIGELHKEVDTMKTTLADKELMISEQFDEMNKAYVVSGTFRDLKEKGLLAREGGILGIGAKESLQENSIQEELFTQVDITETRTIPVNSKSAKLVTDHPANSYELVKDASDMVAYIEIKDPTAFWKISKYAVVEVNR
jgi:uncharacterized protein (DUF3084 family)